MLKQDTTRGPLGTVRISDRAIASISAIATKEIPEVIDLQGDVLDFIADFFGKSSESKGIRVDLLGKDVVIEISICVKYGADISEVTSKIQEKVRNSVEDMTGLTVTSVNVNVSTIKNK